MAEQRVAERTVPPLVGRLPPQCRKDVDELRRVVYATVARQAPDAAVSPADFREVLLTGATGFVGRFFLRELLAQNNRLKVCCLVRADSPVLGFERVRTALEHAEIWEDRFSSRLRVVPGDIPKPASDLAKACSRNSAGISTPSIIFPPTWMSCRPTRTCAR